MSNWWERGYPGGKMVKVPGFPRPLYPPDASTYGKQASANGPDVEAYKRTVSRAGRWPWQTFDQAYSNGFAHGTSGNVGKTGVSGVQRQQDIDDTGWIGETTFNTLRSIVIPDGLPHAGEMAMDATAANLISDAWDMFGGREPSVSKGTVRAAALARAKTQIGTAESPPNSNQVKYTDWYGMVGPWCAMFATWCFELGAQDIGKDSPSFVRGSRYSYVPYIIGDAQAHRYGLATTIDPVAGDLVCFDWDWDGVYDHVGLFVGWQSGANFSTVEGNTSGANDSNGGEVMQRTRTQGAQGTVFVRVAEP
jgi:hypothetical protein